MLFNSLFFLLLALPTVVLASKDSIHTQLVKLAAENNGVIKLDPKTYDLLSSPKRDWSASIHFTALDKRRKCTPCKEFEPSWVAVAKAWSRVSSSERDSHFFATLDFDNGQAIFQKLGIQSAPVVLNFPPAAGPRKSAKPDSPITHDFSSGFDAQPLAEQLSAFTPVPIPFRAPINWAMWGTVTFFVLSGALSIRFLTPILRNAGPGLPSRQYGQETTVIASLYGLLSASFLMLTLVAPLQASPARQRTQIYLWSGVVFILFSVLVSFFRLKNRGYPFKLIL
ncbi:oligosaccharyl transferase subunit OST3/OST6 family [Multifurca ochricompacta]|uniref:Oligosaccharyl transferase subunit OST3/OST6 family n=1 Tax=Multifurca ochricompacta TaxID=376703 RepID=A0AAD4MCG2_9AGAM|nr:oligosaccharyl transferase subunit OST3/OST6 family [Multifurca ochricompacta]